MRTVEDIKTLIMGSPAMRAHVSDTPFRFVTQAKHIFFQGLLPSMQMTRSTGKEKDAP